MSSLKQVRAPNIPHGYPSFIDFWSLIDEQIPFDVADAEAVLVSIGPGLAPEDQAKVLGLQIERIWLE